MSSEQDFSSDWCCHPQDGGQSLNYGTIIQISLFSSIAYSAAGQDFTFVPEIKKNISPKTGLFESTFTI